MKRNPTMTDAQHVANTTGQTVTYYVIVRQLGSHETGIVPTARHAPPGSLCELIPPQSRINKGAK